MAEYVLEQFGFKSKTCFCGAKLAGQVSVTSYRYGTLPQAKCPECNREMLLDGPPKELVVKEPEPVVAEVVEPAKVSKRKATAKK